MARGGNRSAASWMFGLLLLAFLVWVFVFAPDTLPEYKQRMLGVFLASLAGLFAFFLTGDIGLELQSIQSRFGFCQVVEAETLIRQVGASPRSYPPFRRPAPYL